MTLFADNFQACSNLQSYFAETVAWYRNGDGDGLEVSAIVARERRARDDSETVERFTEATLVRLKAGAVPGLAADSEGGLGDHVAIASYLGAGERRRYVAVERKDRADGDLEFSLESAEESERISYDATE